MILSDNVHFSPLEANYTIGGSEKRIVPAHPDTGAREELRPTLPHNNRPSLGRLPAKQLHTPMLRVAVSAVA